ncbi:MAG TPA: hypothetical protein VF885_12125 [Arthrobacter sp.]
MMEPTQGVPVEIAIPSIADSLKNVTPAVQPRDDKGKFAPKAASPAPGPQPWETKYQHPIESEQATHQKLLDIVKRDGTSNEWMQDAPPAGDPETEEPEKETPDEEEAPTKEEPAEEPAPEVETIEFDYEAPIFETTVKTEGGQDETLKLSLKELQSGYMRQADYQRKTQEVAKQREEAQKAVKAEVDKAAAQYYEGLEKTKVALVQLAAPELKDVNWSKLASEDPAEFVRLSAKANDLKGVLQAIDGQIQQQRSKAEEEHKANLAKAVQESVETLQRDMPGWNNELYASILKSGEDYGFSRDELASVYDARVIKMLHDAAKYRQLQQAKPEIAKKVVTVPKVVKPGSPQATNPQAAATDKAAGRLAKTGRWQDAAALLLARGIK